jgi:TonB-dependent starch-binding outer membrane protein SusC
MNYLCKILGYRPWVKEKLRKMRLTVFLLCITAMASVASLSYAQSTKLTVDMKNAKVISILNEIENQSKFRFFFSNDVDVERKATIDLREVTVFEILDVLFKGTNVKYEVYERQIALIDKSAGSFFNRNYVEYHNVQQQRTITGTVTDEDGQPLPGVSILVKGTTQGTVTNDNGDYSLTNVSTDATLVFSFVGMRTQEVVVDDQTSIDIVMKEETIGIEEVVAIGYGTRRAGEITGSVSAIQTEKLRDIPAVTTADLLQGTMSGVRVTKSHVPGSSGHIHVRGIGTIGDMDPLWVIDGVPGGSVSPNEIESISILKNAAAQAIYGARAANGAILVTTKSGKRGERMKINVNVINGISVNTNTYDLLNTREFGEMLWLEAKNSGVVGFSHPIYGSGSEPDIPDYIIPARGTNVDHSLYDRQMVHQDGDDTFLITECEKEGTDWQGATMRAAQYHNFNLDITGGTDNMSYGFMGGYLKEEGIVIHTSHERINLRSNFAFHITDWFELGQRVNVQSRTNLGTRTDNSESSPMSMAYSMPPFMPVYDVAGYHTGSRVASTGGHIMNPVFRAWAARNNYSKQLATTGNIYANITVLEDFDFNSTLGFNYYGNNNKNYNINEVARGARGMYDSLSESDGFGLTWNWSNTLTYAKSFKDMHNVNVMIGSEAINSHSNWRGASREDYFSIAPIYMQLNAGAKSQTNSGNEGEWSLFSLFSRVSYNYDQKYLFEGTFRRDGSSRFGEKNRYGNFPSFSLAWRISQENFMSSLHWLDDLKIRAGWGQVGNDRIGNYNGIETYASNPGSSYYPMTGQQTGISTPGFYLTAFGNPDVRWETTTTVDVGLDAKLWNNYHLVVDVWKRTTSDMLFSKQIPQVMGIASSPSVNVGEMENTGFDFEFGYSGRLKSDLLCDASLFVSHYKNELIKLSGEEGEFLSGGDYRQVNYTRAETGTSFPEFYGYVVEGIFQTEEEAANHPPAFGEDGTYNEPGHFKFKDVNKDGVINDDDRTYIGSPHPDFTAGLNFALNYKNFSLSTRLYGTYGNELANYASRWMDFVTISYGRSKKRLYESWGSPYLDNNENAKMTKMEVDDRDSQEGSSHFIEDASYLRMQNLKIGYNLTSLLEASGFRNLEIYGQVTNVFTITKYSGLDPEVSGSDNINFGVDAGSWPTPRQFLLGINIGF